jgi:hypothetical protein
MKNILKALILAVALMLICSLGYRYSIIYPAPGNLAGTCHLWNVWVDGKPAQTWFYSYRNCMSFEFKGSCTVKVQYKGDAIKSAKVMPSEYGIPVTISGDTVTFELRDNTKGKVVLRINNSVSSEIYIFGNPPAPAVPKGAVEFSGDVYPGKTYQLKSNTTYYFHAGALVHTCFQGYYVDNVTLMGPGVISAPSDGGETIQISGGNHITLDDITVTSEKTTQPTFNILMRTDMNDVKIKNLKMLSYNKCGDGLAIGGAVGVNVCDSFFNVSDDCWDIGYSDITSNLTYNNNVCYFSDLCNDNTGESGIIHIQGAEELSGLGLYAKLENITIRNTYVIGWDCGIIAANWGQNHWDYTKDFVIDGLWVEPDSRSLHHGASWKWADVGLSMNPLFYTWDNSSGPFISGPHNIILKNVYFNGYTINHTVIDKHWTVTFNNVHDQTGLITDISQIDKSGDGTLVIDNN